MLIVIINKCKNSIIKSIEKELEIDITITDKNIYSILNSEIDFNGKKHSLYKIEKFVDEIVNVSNSKRVLLHTFNPLILNFFEDEVAKNSFVTTIDGINFTKFFENEKNKSKLECMGPGEVVIDTKFEEED